MAVGLIFGAKIIHANLMCKGHNTYCQSQLTLSACVFLRRKKLATGKNQPIAPVC